MDYGTLEIVGTYNILIHYIAYLRRKIRKVIQFLNCCSTSEKFTPYQINTCPEIRFPGSSRKFNSEKNTLPPTSVSLELSKDIFWMNAFFFRMDFSNLIYSLGTETVTRKCRLRVWSLTFCASNTRYIDPANQSESVVFQVIPPVGVFFIRRIWISTFEGHSQLQRYLTLEHTYIYSPSQLQCFRKLLRQRKLSSEWKFSWFTFILKTKFKNS